MYKQARRYDSGTARHSASQRKISQSQTAGQALDSAHLVSPRAMPFQDNRYHHSRQQQLQSLANQRRQASTPTQRFSRSADVLETKEKKTAKNQQAHSYSLPTQLKQSIEQLSGYSMKSVRVHYNSAAPAQLQAHAFAENDQIHLAPGQNQHLPHEAWHLVQQKQGRVSPTTQLASGQWVNDEPGLEQEANTMGQRAAQLSATTAITANQSETGTDKSSDNRVTQRETWDDQAAANEQALADHINDPAIPGTHATQVGAEQNPLDNTQTADGERHLDPRLLRLLQTVFDNLPTSHVKGNASLARVVLKNSLGEHGEGMASFYSGADHSLNLVVPGDVNSWYYLQFDKWPFGDSVTTLVSEVSHMAEQWNAYQGDNISGMDFLKETLSMPGRLLTHNVTSTGSTWGKIKEGLSTESFVQWIIRHETGHSVDNAIRWSQNHHYQSPACGGWQEIDDAAHEAIMVNDILASVGIHGGVRDNLNAAFNAHTGVGYNSMLNAVQHRRKQDLNPDYRATALGIFEGTNPGGSRLVNHAEHIIRAGLSRPWESGGAPNVGGRAYHLNNQHNNWVSYLHARYAFRNSNYQFQNPGEWFAESYQAYFKGQPNTWGRNLNDPLARIWFTANLVPPPAGGGLLINAVGDLAPIVGPAPPVAAPGADTTAVPSALRNFISATAGLAVNAVKIPFDMAVGTALLPVKIAKKVPPVHWALRHLGF